MVFQKCDGNERKKHKQLRNCSKLRAEGHMCNPIPEKEKGYCWGKQKIEYSLLIRLEYFLI